MDIVFPSGKVNFVLIEISFRFRATLQPVNALSSGLLGAFGIMYRCRSASSGRNVLFVTLIYTTCRLKIMRPLDRKRTCIFLV